MAPRESALVIDDRLEIPLSEFELTAVRASGPGGQNVNKVSSKVQLRWNLGESRSLPEAVLQRFRSLQRRRISREEVFQLSSQRYRDQERNRQDCLDKLRELVQQAQEVPKPRKKTKVPRGAKESRLRDKRSRSATKQSRRTPSFE